MGRMEQSCIDFRTELSGRSVFVTGHTGFKGSWLSIWLAHLGAEVSGYSLEAPTEPSNFHLCDVESRMQYHTIGDIRDREGISKALNKSDPDVVFHLAAQPLVKAGYNNPIETFDTNVMGTVNLLEAVRRRGKPCVVVIVTTDKCYANNEEGLCFREIDPMGGHDPYSASKASAEIVVASYRDSFFPVEKISEHGIQVASARAGNVIGGGDWAPHRIIVDVQEAIANERPVMLRNPDAIRPWQHVLEPLSGYCQLAANMLANPKAEWCFGWNFGPEIRDERTVAEVVDLFVEAWGSGSWQLDQAADHAPEAQVLRLSIEKAVTQLKWAPMWSVDEAIARTARWYRDFYAASGENMLDACYADIHAYEARYMGKPELKIFRSFEPSEAKVAGANAPTIFRRAG